jgi:hypothetical protein
MPRSVGFATKDIDILVSPSFRLRTLRLRDLQACSEEHETRPVRSLRRGFTGFVRSERNVTTVCSAWRCSVRTIEDGNWPGEKGHKKMPFGSSMVSPEISASALERMAGTTGLEPAASAVTESLADVTYWNLTVLTARSWSL